MNKVNLGCLLDKNNQEKPEVSKQGNFPIFSDKEWSKRIIYNRKVIIKWLYDLINADAELSTIGSLLGVDLSDCFPVRFVLIKNEPTKEELFYCIRVLSKKINQLCGIKYQALYPSTMEVIEQENCVELSILQTKIEALNPVEIRHSEEDIDNKIKSYEDKCVDDIERHVVYLISRIHAAVCECSERIQWYSFSNKCNIYSPTEQMYDLFW